MRFMLLIPFLTIAIVIFILLVSAWIKKKQDVYEAPALVADRNAIEMARLLERINTDEMIYPVLPEDIRARVENVLDEYYRS